MSYEIYRITARCPCPCGKGEIIFGDSMNDWNQIREGDIEISCPICCKTLKFTEGGLIDINYPDYHGDPEIKKQMSELFDKIHNYKYRMSKEEKIARLKAYMSAEEYDAFTLNPRTDAVKKVLEELYYSEFFIERYSLQELIDSQKEMRTKRYSTELSGKALEIAEEHKRMLKTIKLNNVLHTINRAIRNYEAYQQFCKIEEDIKADLKKQYEEFEKEYYKDYDAYLNEKKKHIIPYKLVPVER